MFGRIFFLGVVYGVLFSTLRDNGIIPEMTKEQKYIGFIIFFVLFTLFLQRIGYFKYKLKNKNNLYNEKIEEISRSKIKMLDYKINENLIGMRLRFLIGDKEINCFYNGEVKKLGVRDVYFGYDKVPLLIKEGNQEAILILRPSNGDLVFNVDHGTNYNDKVIGRIYQKRIIDYLISETYSSILDKHNYGLMILTNEEIDIINSFISRLDDYGNFNDGGEFINSQQKNVNLVEKMKEDK